MINDSVTTTQSTVFYSFIKCLFGFACRVIFLLIEVVVFCCMYFVYSHKNTKDIFDTTEYVNQLDNISEIIHNDNMALSTEMDNNQDNTNDNNNNNNNNNKNDEKMQPMIEREREIPYDMAFEIPRIEDTIEDIVQQNVIRLIVKNLTVILAPKTRLVCARITQKTRNCQTLEKEKELVCD